MHVECFECQAPVEADNIDAVIERFLAHGRGEHDWTYPEQALRNFARNFAEAVERVGDEVDRRPEIGGITVHPVTGRIDDWCQLFDRDGFADNPDWASCYCLEPHAPPSDEEPERPWRETRQLMIDRLRGGSSFGYLAEVDGTTAGWVNASLRSDYQLYADVDPDGPDPATVVGVSCFVIAPPFRQHGVASALLDRVIADTADRGADWIEAYPSNDPRDGAQHLFRGTRAMYDGRGFTEVEVRERFTVVRRPAR